MMKKIYPLLLVLLVTAVSACDKWPPLDEEVMSHFQRNKQSLSTLKDEFLKTDLDVLNYSVLSGIGTPKDRKQAEKHKSAIQQKDKFVKLFKDAKVLGISREDAAVYFELTTEVRSGKHYSLQYSYSSRSKSSLCESDFRDVECGTCSIRVEDQWWIEYSWYPNSAGEDLLECFKTGMEQIKSQSQAADM